ncbi:uncharacterized protein LOC127802137 [Diospyros lotus]|uniref:uncharacterized protein LOC127802137 n=1 Tax=Diospyros lotus TaxID=55363 RepID=UPI002256993B|nr:uncharacterized protein LOC127802137 [Diospyros lotus]
MAINVVATASPSAAQAANPTNAPATTIAAIVGPTVAKLWEAPDKKHKLEDVNTKKFLVNKFLDYKMVDTKLVVNQLEELQVIFSDLLSEELVINEPLQVATVIEKLSCSWKDFKNYLKHKRKELSMEDMAVRLYIEKDNRKGDKSLSSLKLGLTWLKFQRLNLRSNKTGYRAIDCNHKKGQSFGNNQCKNRPSYANMMEKDVNLVAVVTNVCMVFNTKGWWINTRATRHNCGDRALFSTYEKSDNIEKLYMGNALPSPMEGTCK